MDTDDLTRDAYAALIIESGKISEYLQPEIGAAARKFNNEDDYLRAIYRYVVKIARYPEDYLDSWNLLDEVDAEHFGKDAAGLADRILEVIKTPLKERGPTRF